MPDIDVYRVIRDAGGLENLSEADLRKCISESGSLLGGKDTERSDVSRTIKYLGLFEVFSREFSRRGLDKQISDANRRSCISFWIAVGSILVSIIVGSAQVGVQVGIHRGWF